MALYLNLQLLSIHLTYQKQIVTISALDHNRQEIGPCGPGILIPILGDPDP
jgi:hypothetical protein